MAVTKMVIIPADDNLPISIVRAESGLSELQGLVGGYIESIGRMDDAVALGNEDGKLDGLPYNDTAHRLLGVFAGHNSADPVVGTIVLTGVDGEGETGDVPDWLVDAVTTYTGREVVTILPGETA